MLYDNILPEEELDEYGNPLPPKKTSRVAAFLSDDEDEITDDIPEEIEESPDDYSGLSDGDDEPIGDY